MNNTHNFSIGDALSYGWNAFKKNPIIIFYFIASIILPVLVSVVIGIPLTMLAGENKLLSAIIGFIINIGVNILSYIFAIGMIRIGLNIYEGKSIKFSNLYQDYRLVYKYFITSMLLGLLILISLIPGIISFAVGMYLLRDYIFLFFIPVLINLGFVIYLSTRWSMWAYMLVDKRAGINESLKMSWLATKGNVVNLILLSIVQGCVVIVGFLALILGIFAAIPITGLMTIFVYKSLTGSIPSANPTTPAPQPGSVSTV